MHNYEIDREYEIDLVELQKEFKSVNTRDVDSLRKWFETNSHLNFDDLGRVANVGRRTIYNWRKRCGLAKTRQAQQHYYRHPLPDAPVAPPDWRESDWLIEQYQFYSTTVLARAVGYDRTWVFRILSRKMKEKGLETRTPQESLLMLNHKYCNRRWLVEHYVTEEMSVNRVSEIAGVSSRTLSNWLSYFKIRIRSKEEQSSVDRRKLCRLSG